MGKLVQGLESLRLLVDGNKLLSNEEKQFYEWLFAMAVQQKILWFAYEPMSFILSDKVETKQGNFLLNPHIYTPDFVFFVCKPTDLPIMDLPSGTNASTLKKLNLSKCLRGHTEARISVINELFTKHPELEDWLDGTHPDDILIVFVDTKGTYSKYGNSSNQEFSINRKWVYQKYGIFINKVIPNKFFKDINYEQPKKKTNSRRKK